MLRAKTNFFAFLIFGFCAFAGQMVQADEFIEHTIDVVETGNTPQDAEDNAWAEADWQLANFIANMAANESIEMISYPNSGFIEVDEYFIEIVILVRVTTPPGGGGGGGGGGGTGGGGSGS